MEKIPSPPTYTHTHAISATADPLLPTLTYSPVISTDPSQTLCKHTLMALLFPPHLQTALRFPPLMFSPPSPPLIASLSPAEESVSLRCLLITGTMGRSAGDTAALSAAQYTRSPAQCHTSPHKLVIRLVQRR